ncbi:MAG: glycoside hydrolase family 113 [Planctomycetota bacterium]
MPSRHEKSCLRAAVACFALLALACQRRDPVDWQSGGAALMRNLLRANEVDVVCEEALASACELAAADSERAYAFDYRIVPGKHEVRAGAARIVVGTYEFPPARALLDHVGVRYGDWEQGRGFLWQEQVFVARNDALIATFEDPERPGLPVTLVFGNEVEPLARYIGELAPAYRPWIRFFHSGELTLSGPMSVEGLVIQHKLDRLGARDYAISIDFAELPVVAAGVRGRASRAIPPVRLRAYLEAVDAARARIARWMATPDASVDGAAAAALPIVALSLYAEPEHFAVKGGVEGLGYVNPVTRSVHALCAEHVPDDGGAAVAAASALEIAGPPAHAWMLDAAGVDAAGAWWGGELVPTAVWIATAGRAPEVAELADARAELRRSRHVLVPLRALLLRFLRESRGDGFVRQLWNGTTLLPAGLDPEFSAWLARAADEHVDDMRMRRELPRATTSFLKGVGVAERDRAPEHGFGSRAYLQSLTEIGDLGANAVLLSSSLSDTFDPPEFAGLGAAGGYGALEGDLQLFAAITRAKARGLAVLVSPSLLTSPNGSLRGSYLGPNEQDVAQTFESYARFLEHFGLIAELARADWLSIGTRIPELATPVDEGRRGRPESAEWKRAGWARAIRAARGVFTGRLLLSVSSPRELEKIELWKDLDAIGLELDVEVDRRNASGTYGARRELLDDLTSALAEVEAFAARVDRPFVITQAGFERRRTPARRTPAGFGASEVDLQYLGLSILASMYNVRARTPHWQGIFLWRWSSDPADPGASDHDWLLSGSPGLELVERSFRAQ